MQPFWRGRFFFFIGFRVNPIWLPNHMTYDDIFVNILLFHTCSEITLISYEYLLCAKFKCFPWCGFRDTEVQIFCVFPTWLPHDVTYNVIIVIKTFYMCSHTSGENFVLIRQAVAEKKTRKFYVDQQTNR